MRALRRGFLAAGTALAILLLSYQSAPLAQADERLTISGTLTAEDGTPLGGLNTCADPVDTGVVSDARRECVLSEPSTGAFTISNLVPSTYQLVAWGDNYKLTYFGINGPTTNPSDVTTYLELKQSITDRNITLFAKPTPELTPAGTPKVTGTAKAGKKLTAKPGAWAAGATLSYQWLRGKEAIAGATKTTYKVQAADGGARLSVRVTGSKADFADKSQTSAATKVVPLSKLKSAKPKLSGTAVVGSSLTAKPGKWTAGTKLTYQWLRAGKAIAGASSEKYVLTASDLGKAIKVKVTGTKQGYKAVAKASKATKKVK